MAAVSREEPRATTVHNGMIKVLFNRPYYYCSDYFNAPAERIYRFDVNVVEEQKTIQRRRRSYYHIIIPTPVACRNSSNNTKKHVQTMVLEHSDIIFFRSVFV
jgi:hypothetical protein